MKPQSAVAGGRRYLPYAFTEQGVAMLSSVLRSSRAVQVNIAIMRTFVRLREMLLSNTELARKLVVAKNRKGSFSLEKIVNRFSADMLTNAR